jgi:ketosteroid isomerase-like protein
METLTTTAKIETVQHAFEDFAKRNIAGILNACSDDITWSSWNNPVVPFARTYHGKAGAASFFKDLSDAVDYTAFEPREFYDCGDRVFVKVYHAANVKATGKSFGHETLMEFVFSAGKICSFFAYVDSHDEAEAFLN